MAKSSFRSKIVLGVLAAGIVVSLAWLGYALAQSSHSGNREHLVPAMAAKERHEGYLMAHPDVVGAAVGLTDDARPAVKVYTRKGGAVGIPDSLDGIPVVVEATGEFFALRSGGGTSTGTSTTSKWSMPVPIGVSTGNIGECSAGTIAARLIKGTGVYALSNNHVYALENRAPINSKVMQPGLYDARCSSGSANVIGTLADFEPIVFSTSASNTIDAAIALSSTSNLGRATPSNGYGTPKSLPVAAAVGLAVQKYGRTTQLTKGSVTGINATILISYGSGTARFINQVVVGSSTAFIKSGDSGSLLVTNPGANPVGLLFAGSSTGTTAIANPIGAVLSRFSATVDGN